MTALVGPSVILLLVLNAFPLIAAAVQSVHDGTLIGSGPYVGLDNFSKALGDDAFWKAARFTVIYTIAGVFGGWALGLALALMLRTNFPGAGVFKVLLLLPWVAPVVVSTTSWNWLVATSSSPLPMLADALGLGHPLFLADPKLAAVTVLIFKVWSSFPFMMLMAAAALEGVDPTIYEAARVDGASSFQQFRLLTLPIISKPTYISWLLMMIFCVNDFPHVYLLTGGGPVDATTTLVVMAYRVVFQNFQTGYGVAIAFLMSIALISAAMLIYRQIRRSVM